MVGEEYYEELENAQEDYEDDIASDQAERQRDIQDEVYEDTTPSYEKKDDLYSLFWKVVKANDSSKVANVTKEELGMLNISVRDCQRISLLAETLGHPGFALFFREQAEIILATSASRKGWLAELFVSMKKFNTKQRGESNLPGLQSSQPQRKGLFNRR